MIVKKKKKKTNKQWQFLTCDISLLENRSVQSEVTPHPGRAGGVKPGAVSWSPSPSLQGESPHCTPGETPGLAKGLQRPLQTGTATKPRRSQ